MVSNEALRFFVRESNRIEGIHRDPLDAEIEAHLSLLDCKRITQHGLRAFVQIVAGAPLRDKPGLDVYIGNHRPPIGGPHVPEALDKILQGVNDKNANPYTVHAKYETLHPFMDGNGRSGRALWLYMMVRRGYTGFDRHGNNTGFLQIWYYQSLSNFRE